MASRVYIREGDTKPQPKTAIITYSFLPPGFILGHVLAHVEKDEMRNIPTRVWGRGARGRLTFEVDLVARYLTPVL